MAINNTKVHAALSEIEVVELDSRLDMALDGLVIGIISPINQVCNTHCCKPGGCGNEFCNF